MDAFLARTMVESLSKGLNPLTGCVLSPRDVCSSEEVQEALIAVLEHCSIESTEQYLHRLREEKTLKRQQNRLRYTRAGEPWTAEEDDDILRLHRKGYTVIQIAGIAQRTPGAIISRLKRLGVVPHYRIPRRN